MAKNLELYNRTVDILYQAFFNDTLEAADCTACAVGNIVAANMGMKLVKNHHHITGLLFCFIPEDYERSNPLKDSGLWFDHIGGPGGVCYPISPGVQQQVDATGYTVEELHSIERVFMDAWDGEELIDCMFNGLVAVLDKLAEIHEIDENVSIADREKFRDHYELRLA